VEADIPEFNALPAERRDEILRACRESDEYRALNQRQAPRLMIVGAAITLAIVGVLVLRHEISLGTAVIVTWAIFLLCIPPVRWWNRRGRRHLLERLVRERLRQGDAALK